MEESNPTNPPSRKITRLVGRYTTEVIVIFIGITISFLFDQWRAHRAEVKKEVEFINSLITDLKHKANELQEGDLRGATRLLQNADTLLDCFYNQKKLPDHVALFWVKEYSGRWSFGTTTPTYRSSSSTGEWQELPDSLRRKIYKIYEAEFFYLNGRYALVNQLKDHFVNTYLVGEGVFRILNFPQADGQGRIVELNKTKKVLMGKEFINNVTLLSSYAKTDREVHLKTIEDIHMLISDLESYLKKLD